MKHSRHIQSSIFSWKKKGVTSRMLLEMGGMIFAVIVILIFYSFGANLLNIFLKDPTTELAKGNFNALLTYVDDVLNDKLPYATEYGKPITIPDKFVIAGFDKNIGDKMITSECHTRNPAKWITGSKARIFAPTVCGDKACLVLLKNLDFEWFTSDIKSNENQEDIQNYQKAIDDAAVDYKVFDNVDQLSGAYEDETGVLGKVGNFGSVKPDNSQFFYGLYDLSDEYHKKLFSSESLLLFGDCKDLEYSTWGVRNVYIDKYTKKDASDIEHTQVYIAKENDLTTERSTIIKATMKFNKFVDAYNSCKSSLSVQSYSQFTPNTINFPCICEQVSVDLPTNSKIVILNGKMKLHMTDSSGADNILTSLSIEQPGEISNTDTASLFSTYLKDEFDIYPGDTVDFYKSGNSVSISLNEKNQLIDSQCVKVSQITYNEKKSMATSIFDSLSSAYQHYSPSQYVPEADGKPCLMGSIAFEKDTNNNYLPNGYIIYINAPETNTFSLYDPDGSLLKKAPFAFYNSPCSIDQSGNKKEIDYTTPLHSADIIPVSDYTFFFLAGTDQCFGEKGITQFPSIPICTWAKKDSREKNADSALNALIDCFSNINPGTQCTFNANEKKLPSNYAIQMRKDSSSTIVSLLKDNYVVEEKSVPGIFCTMLPNFPVPSCNVQTLRISSSSVIYITTEVAGSQYSISETPTVPFAP